MFLAASNKVRRLMYLSYIGHVRAEELARGLADIRALVADLPKDFRLLVDLSQLDTMSPDCLTELGRIMEVFDQSAVGMIVRVIPDPEKDIGFNILTVFHYPHHPRILTCRSLAEAEKRLGLDH
jgi:hypothetical protein